MEGPSQNPSHLPISDGVHSRTEANYQNLSTPAVCVADFCLIPIGTPTPSVSAQIADVQRLLAKSGLSYSMHSAGTTVEGSWDDVMRIIGQAHSMLHEKGILRVQTDIRVGSRPVEQYIETALGIRRLTLGVCRTDKKQTFDDKIKAVEKLLAADTE